MHGEIIFFLQWLFLGRMSTILLANQLQNEFLKGKSYFFTIHIFKQFWDQFILNFYLELYLKLCFSHNFVKSRNTTPTTYKKLHCKGESYLSSLRRSFYSNNILQIRMCSTATLFNKRFADYKSNSKWLLNKTKNIHFTFFTVVSWF